MIPSVPGSSSPSSASVAATAVLTPPQHERDPNVRQRVQHVNAKPVKIRAHYRRIDLARLDAAEEVVGIQAPSDQPQWLTVLSRFGKQLQYETFPRGRIISELKRLRSFW